MPHDAPSAEHDAGRLLALSDEIAHLAAGKLHKSGVPAILSCIRFR